MGKKNKKSKNNSPPKKVKKKQARPQKTPEEIALETQMQSFDVKANPYTNEFRKKLRALDKRINKITALEERDRSELNEDQLRSLGEKPRLVERKQDIIDLQSAMVKVAIMQSEPKSTVEECAPAVEDVSSSMVTEESVVVVPRPEQVEAEILRKILTVIHCGTLGRQGVQAKCEEAGVECEPSDLDELGAFIGKLNGGRAAGGFSEKLELGIQTALEYVHESGSKLEAICNSCLD